MTQPATAREYTALGRTTDIFGRVLCSIRDHHFVIDGPVQNDCPGEEVTPGEVFLASIAACGMELMQVIAREDGVPLTSARVRVTGIVDRSKQARDDVTTFNSAHFRFELSGVEQAQAETLVEKFTRRCPLYGTLAIAVPDITREVVAA
jgi:uncharacterized OsmC-like protein